MPSQPPTRYLILGPRGWIGGKITSLLHAQNADVHTTLARLEDASAIAAALDEVQPDCVINCAGKTGRPNIDWCEEHKVETIESNVIGTLIVANECAKRGVHLTVLATGCKSFYTPHRIAEGRCRSLINRRTATGIYTSTYTPSNEKLLSAPIKETEPANFGGSFYSYTKSRVEDILQHFPQTLILRVRMPVSADLHPRSFVTKIKSYDRVVNVPNSHTILPELLPMVIQLASHRETGVYNFTNPGAASHNEVLEMYRDFVELGFTWRNFSVEEQSKVVKADRSNCVLDAGKLMGKVEEYRREGVGVEVRPIREAYAEVFKRMREGGAARGGAVEG